MERPFPLDIFFRKETNTSRGIHLFSFSPELPEIHCTICFVPLVPCFNDKIRGFFQLCLMLQIVQPALSQRNSQLCAKGTRFSHSICLRKNRTVPFDAKLSPVFPYRWKAPGMHTKTTGLQSFSSRRFLFRSPR